MPIELAGKYHQPPLWHRVFRAEASSPRGNLALVGILLPFAAGYFLSYWIRTANGPIAEGLSRSFGLGPADLGLMTSLYFLTFAAFQIPAGLLIDRFGPRRVQAVMMLVAALGALLFAGAHGRGMLMLGRALIGLGCSSALVSGIKMLALWLPPERRASGNCCLVMCGGLGAMASAAPIGFAEPEQWRLIFVLFGILSLCVAGILAAVTPEMRAGAGRTPQLVVPSAAAEIGNGLRRVLADRRFWRLAPLSAAVVGSAFAIHGLWAARWLAEVEGAAPAAIVTVLLTMGAALTTGALLFGVLATRLRRRGITTTQLFGASSVAFLLVEGLLVSRTSVPPSVSLGAFGLFGAITVLSFTILGEMFPTSLNGRANAALNVLHLGAAFAIQAGIGAVVARWPAAVDGHRPASAYTTAFAILMALQAAALVWFGAGFVKRESAAEIVSLPGRLT